MSVDYDDFVRSKRRAECATGHQPEYYDLAIQNIEDALREQHGLFAAQA